MIKGHQTKEQTKEEIQEAEKPGLNHIYPSSVVVTLTAVSVAMVDRALPAIPPSINP